ncbi:TYRO protein tyrosine kinase-binding protein isoform X2 [Syngnathoides biaculeatus]|uniref:TYRO protein tyrosine kinase-binding protein isoform X2 n=1 Tax=Syngnathoides biaculeatus TaxID=300417 RepID=UPI002ADD3B93|nr:TYRO protein tyrosine kinase-binding protein isoform X2 [Syngnathoides biaculeatus]
MATSPLWMRKKFNMKDMICISGSPFGSAGQQESGSCYVISLQSVMGIIASDFVLTVFIAISLFSLLTLYKKTTEKDAKIHVQEPEEITESPYQELHGTQSDVYCELQHLRK